jgi:hypothetical protein
MVTFCVDLIGFLEDVPRAELDAELALLAPFGYYKNAAVRDLDILFVKRFSPVLRIVFAVCFFADRGHQMPSLSPRFLTWAELDVD